MKAPKEKKHIIEDNVPLKESSIPMKTKKTARSNRMESTGYQIEKTRVKIHSDELKSNCETSNEINFSSKEEEKTDNKQARDEDGNDILVSNSSTQQSSDMRLEGKKKHTVKPLSESSAQKFQEDIDNTGLVYLSRIPPYMKPQKIRHLLSQYGEVGRVYLAPEDERIHEKRKKLGGNKKLNYTEGWVEFKDKRIAKRVSITLNNQPIGGKKRDYYHDDLWNIKYLSKFKWHHLTERMVYERAVRDQKLRNDISQAAKENAFFIQNVEKSKMIHDIEDRKKRKAEKAKSIDM